MNKTLLIIIAFAAIYIIWGTTYLTIVIGLETIPPFAMASLRFLIAGILLVGYSLIKREGLPSGKALLKNLLIGTTVLAGGQGLLIWSEQYIASGYASVLVATLPIWFVIMDRTNWNFYFKNYLILTGIALGFIGIGVLFGEKLASTDEDFHLQIFASCLVLMGAMCWVVGTLYNRSKPAKGSLHKNLGWQLIFGFFSCMVISFVLGEPIGSITQQASSASLLAVLYLAIAGSIIAYVAYTWLLKQMPSAIVGTYAYVNPIVAVILGWMLADEIISTQQLVGMIIILISAILINLNRNKKTA